MLCFRVVLLKAKMDSTLLVVRMVLIARRSEFHNGVTLGWSSDVRCTTFSRRMHLLRAFRSIFWPFEADQPMNAALVSIIHQAGYELIEARQGLALRPMHRLNGRAPEGTVEALRKEATEVLKKARGEDGQVRRMNAQRLGEQFASYWAPDGAGWKELQRIADVLR